MTAMLSGLGALRRDVQRSVRLFRSFRHEQSDPVGFYRLLADDTLGLVEQAGPVEGMTVLDVGGGPGHYARAFRSAGATSFVVDISSDELQSAGAQSQALVGDAGRLPFADDSIDVVFSSNMLEHVWDPDHVRGEFVRVLKPGGTLVLAYTNWLSPWGGHETSPWHYLGGRFAVRRYRRKRGLPPKNRFGSSLFPISVADGLRWARRHRELELVQERPRYLPQAARFVLLIPGLREFVTWNLWQIFRKRPTD